MARRGISCCGDLYQGALLHLSRLACALEAAEVEISATTIQYFRLGDDGIFLRFLFATAGCCSAPNRSPRSREFTRLCWWSISKSGFRRQPAAHVGATRNYSADPDRMRIYYTNDARFYRRLAIPLRAFMIAGMIVITIIGTSNEPAQFIYFQF